MVIIAIIISLVLCIPLLSTCVLLVTAQTFAAKSFLKPFIPVYGSLVIGKNCGIGGLVGAIIKEIGSIGLYVYMALALDNVGFAVVIYTLIFFGTLIFQFFLFRFFTHRIGHSILLMLFGGFMLLLGKKTKDIFIPLFMQMWDFEYQGNSSNNNGGGEPVVENISSNNNDDDTIVNGGGSPAVQEVNITETAVVEEVPEVPDDSPAVVNDNGSDESLFSGGGEEPQIEENLPGENPGATKDEGLTFDL